MSESNHADDEIRRVESRLRQEQLIQSSLSNGDSAWTIVYEDWHHAEDHGGRYIMLSQPSIRERVLADACWDLMKGDGTPGFSKSYEDGEQVTEYCRTGCGPDIEPLVIVQEFHGAVPDALLISEEFRLLMNLWLDPKTGDYYRIEDDGSRDLAIRISLSKIEIRTPILKRYLAARQLDAVVFVDSVVSEPIGDNHDYSHLDLERTVQDNFILSRNIGTLHREEIFSQVLAKRIIKAPPQQTCGLWPWDKVSASENPEFIIGEDDYGRPISTHAIRKNWGTTSAPIRGHHIISLLSSSSQRCSKGTTMTPRFTRSRPVAFHVRTNGVSRSTTTRQDASWFFSATLDEISQAHSGRTGWRTTSR